MNKVIPFLILFLFLVWQITLVSRVVVFGVCPNLLLAAVLVLTMLRQGRTNLFWAFLAGLLLDFFSALPFGFYALGFVLIVWLTQFVGKSFFKINNFWGKISLIASANMAYNFLNILLIKVFQLFNLISPSPLWPTAFKAAIISFFLNTLLALIIFTLTRKIHGHLARI